MNELTHDFPAPTEHPAASNDSAPQKMRNVKLEGEDKAQALSMHSEMAEVKRQMDEARSRFEAEMKIIQDNWGAQVLDFWERMGKKFNFDGNAVAMTGTWILDTSLHADLDIVLIREMQRTPKQVKTAQVGRRVN